jgi:hypothetical protein
LPKLRPILQVALFAILQAWNWMVSKCTKQEQKSVDMKDICPECVDGVCPMRNKEATDKSAAGAVAVGDDDVHDDDADSVVTAASEPSATGTKKEL